MEDRTAILHRELEELRAQITALERTLEEEPDYGLDKGAPQPRNGSLIRLRCSSAGNGLQALSAC